MSPLGTVVVVGDTNNNVLRVIAGGIVSTLAGSGVAAWIDGVGSNAAFRSPYSIVFTPGGESVVMIDGSNRIRLVSMSGAVTTLAGSGVDGGGANGVGVAASVRGFGLMIDAGGTIYFTGSYDNNVRRVVCPTFSPSSTPTPGFSPSGTPTPSPSPPYTPFNSSSSTLTPTPSTSPWGCSGGVTTLAGSGTVGNVVGTGTAAQFSSPFGIAAVSTGGGGGRVFIADSGNHALRTATFASAAVANSAAVVTLAGTPPTTGSSDGLLLAASFNTPTGVALDVSGTVVFVADS